MVDISSYPCQNSGTNDTLESTNKDMGDDPR